MRIHYLNGTRIPATEANSLQVYFTCLGLQAAGAQVTLIVPGAPSQAPALRAAYGSAPTFPIRWLRPGKPRALSLLYRYLRDVLPHERPDVIYTRNKLLAGALVLLRPLHRARIAFEPHEFSALYPRMPRKLLAQLTELERANLFKAELLERRSWPVRRAIIFLENLAYLGADRLIVIIPIARDILAAGGIPSRKVTVSPGIVPLSALRSGARSSLRLRGAVIGYLGSAHLGGTQPRGVDRLLAAAELLPRLTKRPFTLLLVGLEPDAIEQLRSQQSADLRARTVFRERLPYAQMPALLRRLDLGIMLVLGSKLFDYLAAGVPVVATDSRMIRDFLSPNEGALVDTASPEAFARTLASLIDRPAERRRKGRAARARAAQYSHLARGRALVRALERL